MFAILFGLSMDYQVFLLTRIQEHYRESKDNHEAVVDGLAVSARVITSAALIMVSVYTSFILNGDPTVKQFGLGPGGGDRGRRDDRALPARAVGDGDAGSRQLVASGLGSSGSAPGRDRGRRLLQGEGRGRGRGRLAASRLN